MKYEDENFTLNLIIFKVLNNNSKTLLKNIQLKKLSNLIFYLFFSIGLSIASTERVRGLVGNQTKIITCPSSWGQQNPTKAISQAIKEKIGLYGFTKPVIGSSMLPVDTYLTKSIDNLKGGDLNVAVLARAYKGSPFDYIKTNKRNYD